MALIPYTHGLAFEIAPKLAPTWLGISKAAASPGYVSVSSSRAINDAQECPTKGAGDS